MGQEAIALLCAHASKPLSLLCTSEAKLRRVVDDQDRCVVLCARSRLCGMTLEDSLRAHTLVGEESVGRFQCGDVTGLFYETVSRSRFHGLGDQPQSPFETLIS